MFHVRNEKLSDSVCNVFREYINTKGRALVQRLFLLCYTVLHFARVGRFKGLKGAKYCSVTRPISRKSLPRDQDWSILNIYIHI